MRARKIQFRYLGLWIGAAIALAWTTGLLPQFDREMIENWIVKAGPWGPVLIVVLMTASIVASPIPSAPIALVSGAAYGHVTGGLLHYLT